MRLKKLLLLLSASLLFTACDNPFSPMTFNEHYTGDGTPIQFGDSYEPDNTTGAAYYGSIGSSYSHTLTDSDEDWTYVYLTSGNTYTISTSGTAPVDLYVYSNAGSTLVDNESNSSSATASVTVTPASSAYYYINVNGYYSYSIGSYSLTISSGTPTSGGDSYESDNTVSSAQQLTVGTSQSHTLTSNDTDWVSVSLVAGTIYTITAGSTPDVVMSLWGSNGSTIRKGPVDDHASGTAEVIVDTITTTGTYYIMVRGYSSSTGAYSLSVTQSGAAFSDDSFEPDNSTSSAYYASTGSSGGRTLVSGDEDWVKVDLEAGNSYTIQAVGTSLYTNLMVYSDAGTTIAGTDVDGSFSTSSVTVTPSVSQTYYIHVNGYYVSSMGSYLLTISSGTPVVTVNKNLLTDPGTTWTGYVNGNATGGEGTLTPFEEVLSQAYVVQPYDGTTLSSYEIDGVAATPFTGLTAVSVSYQCTDSVAFVLKDGSDNFYMFLAEPSPTSVTNLQIPVGQFLETSTDAPLTDGASGSFFGAMPWTFSNILSASVGTISLSKVELIGVAP